MTELDQVVLAAFLYNMGKFCPREQFYQYLAPRLASFDDAGQLFAPPAHLAKLIQAASEFAQSERDDNAETSQPKHLEALLARVKLNPRNNATYQSDYYQPLQELSLHQSQMYPQAGADQAQIPHADYQQLLQAFQTQLQDNFPRPIGEDEASLRNVVYNLMSLLERFLVYVPAEVQITHPDISLFDQMRVMAAIAEGLYRYHDSHHDLATADFLDKQTPKWHLVCGDFSGIQSFIYRLTAKGAAKGLRGRSLYIQLLCDGVAQFLLRKLGLYPTARIYSSGGKFYLLIAACQDNELKQQVNEINRWLLQAFNGEVFLGIGITPICANDFRGNRMGDKWQAVNGQLHQDRLQRFRSVMAADFFAPQTLATTFCHVCGRDDAAARLKPDRDRERQICIQCDQLEQLGQKIAQADYFLWVWGNDRHTVRHFLATSPTSQFAALECDLYLLEEYPKLERSQQPIVNTLLERINNVDCLDNNPLGYRCGFRFLGKWNPHHQSQDWHFDDFAEHAQGPKRMGVLRMDVDNLGEIFARGLEIYLDQHGKTQSMGSLSRVATLSRQLNLFFSGHLNELLKNFTRTQIIYAGGDDVFLIGSWDELPRVANTIRSHFTEYCANNPCFTVSAGMSLVGGKYPISKAAALAGEAEEHAKQLRYNHQEKNAFCLLETPIPWTMYPAIEQVRQQIIEVIERTGNRAIINRLRSVILTMQEYERYAHRHGQRNYDEMIKLVQYQKWRWQLVYNLARMQQRHTELSDKIEAIQNIIFSNKINDQSLPLPVEKWLQLPVRWAEFLTRTNNL
jgi:CRISPR-associated protein Csm1